MANHVLGPGFLSVNVGAEYTKDEVEFLKAVDAYRIKTKTKFLLATDYLKILVKLGYSKPKPGEGDLRHG